MAQEGFGVSDSPMMNICSTNQEMSESVNAMVHTDRYSVENGDGNNCSSLMKEVQIDASPSETTPKPIINEVSSSQITDSLPSEDMIKSNTSPEVLDKIYSTYENVAATEGNVQNDNNESTSNGKSIEAISLVDIKASFENDCETVSGNVDNEKTGESGPGNNDLDISVQEIQSEGESRLQNILDNKLSNDSDSGKDVISQEPHQDKEDESTSTIDSNNSQRIISSYAIQPGELTNQLIEGPSITLPSSQVRNRLSSPSNTCDSPSGKEKQSNCITSASELNRNESSSGISLDEAIKPSASQLSSASESSPVDPISSSATPTTTPSSSTPPSSADSSESSTATISAVPAKKVKKTPHDFIFGKVLGEGSYSTVYLAKEVSTQREFAVKVCEKKHLIREHKTHFVMREKDVLMKLDHPFFIKLAYTFQDPERLYYVLTYARNGELLTYLNKLSAFDVPCTRFYSAEVVVALEYLQSLGIIHRDLKPENILLGDDMHIKITDFGTSKMVNGDVQQDDSKGKLKKRKNSFVGTAEYVSPEVLNGLPANYGTDLWALGCIIFQCLSSSLPFRSGNEYQTFQKILKLEYDFPDGFLEEAKDLVQKLLVIEPTERLGMKQPGGMEELKRHPFYAGIDWDSLPTTSPPKLLPYLPASASNPEFWGGQEQRTGFDDQRLAEIITGQSAERSQSPEMEPVSTCEKNGMEESECREKIEKQRQENQFHQFVENNFILRQGFVDKRKGFFARKRMLLLTEGPHLYYVDAHNKVLKGEIPWSKELRAEAKNFKIFFVHTPNRTYYLESRNPDAHHWVKRIQDVWNQYYGDGKESS